MAENDVRVDCLAVLHQDLRVRVLVALLLVSIVLIPLLLRELPERASAAPLPPPAPAKGIGYGVMTLAAPDRLDRAKSIGFNWVKVIGSWKAVQPTDRHSFNWAGLDGDVERAVSRGMRILLRVDEPPSWATGTEARNAPPLDDSALADFLAAVATRYRGKIQAYQIWNEQNTSLEWGGRPPDPAKYARMLKALYPKVKAADPNALIVLGGLATTGDAGTGAEAWGDLVYLRALYEHGAKGFFDAIASHAYGGPYAPETPASAAPLGVYFRRAEDHRKIAEQFGDDPAVWITEFGWLHNFEAPRCDLATYDPYRAPWHVSEATQADYLVRAFRYAHQNWPWVGPMFIYNLDFAIDPWRVRCDPNRFFSLVRGNGAPSLAMSALAAMPRWEQEPPVAIVRPILPVIADTWFTLAWTGSDAISGISSYDVQYRVLPDGAWKPLVSNIADTLLDVEVADRQTYQFRVQPMDWAGNRGAWAESGVTTVSLSGYLMPIPASVTLWLTPTSGSTVTLSLQNVGGAALTWTAAPDQPWLAVAPTGGSLERGQRTMITVTVTGGLPRGTHVGAIVLGGDAWRTGGPVRIEVQVSDLVDRRFLPLVNVPGAPPTAITADARRRARADAP
ncbi:MAG: cellulase family glycosylhydrolase [Chloroflexota bacterium]|nr:cellulase family glycosylhydrolase [Dehalococcoidia bacterium]MDW8253626.1 cellulase family glycosylhydrolase [Chloroflexota bacterium]